MENIYNLTKEDLESYLININDKKFRSTQIYDWLYVKRVKSFDEMTNLSKTLISKLKKDFKCNHLEIVKEEKDKDVSKYLFKLYDENYVETVLMEHNYGLSLCVSSEVGCNMGCIFCESGRLKKVRNLYAYEIVLQILMIEERIKRRISHIVVMGIGEPFDNYDNIMKFVKIINDPKGLAIGSRHITISTCGVVPKIYEFSKEPFQVNLAISLHAPTNELRTKIMPINKAYNIEILIKAVKDYITITNRRVTFEYILLDNVNDKDIDAKNLAKLLKGINVTIRKEFGSNISAACGQLRSKKEEQK